MTTNYMDYRTHLRAAADVINDKYHTGDVSKAIALADYVTDVVEAALHAVQFDHDVLVAIAKDSLTVSTYMMNNKRIMAVKELRTLTKCNLREAKDAVEEAYAIQWKQDTPTVDPYPDESPF